MTGTTVTVKLHTDGYSTASGFFAVVTGDVTVSTDVTGESGADECFSYEDYHEVQCQMSEIYNVKKNLEKIIINSI